MGFGLLNRSVGFLGDGKLALSLIVGVGLLGVGAVAVSGGDLRYPDEKHYYRIARNILDLQLYSFDGQTPTADKPPGYPMILAAVIQLGGGVWSLKLLNVLALVVSAVLVFRFLKRARGSRAGLIGIILIMLYPVFFYVAATLFPQTVGGTLLLVVVNLLLLDEPEVWQLAAGGVVYGFLILTIPTFLLLLGLVVPLVYLQCPARARLSRTALFVAAVALVVVSWTMRNWLAFSELVPLSTNSGVMLLKGNSENATAWSGPGTDISVYKRRAVALDEVARDRFFRGEALRWIGANKAAALRLYWRKLIHYFGYSEELVVEEEGTEVRAWVMMVTYYPLLIAAAAGLAGWKVWRVERREWFLAAIYLGAGLVSAVFFTRIRYRIPVDLLLVVLAGLFWDRALSTVWSWRRRGAVAARSERSGIESVAESGTGKTPSLASAQTHAAGRTVG